MQDRPICFECRNVVEYDPVYEAPCGHDRCRSAVFHGLCLMEYRERRDTAENKFEVVGVLVRPWIQEHGEGEQPNGQ